MKILYIALICILFLFMLACRAQIQGCTDPLANNYNPKATENDGSCTYDPTSITPVSSTVLSEQLLETSGLIMWEGLLWTHNDDTDTKIYGLDTSDFHIIKTFEIEGVDNLDWEEISQDEDYIYLGDIGNNYQGNRTNLHILQIGKRSILNGVPAVDTIWFSYEDQDNFSTKAPMQTNFDCEAFIVRKDSIYLFTKQWLDSQTTVYAFPKKPGTHVAKRIESFDTKGLVTGATYLEAQRMVVLCGYNTMMHPFLYLFYNYRQDKFFSGNKRRVELSMPFHQVEGITTCDGFTYHISSEAFLHEPYVNNPQEMHVFDLKYIFIESAGVEK